MLNEVIYDKQKETNNTCRKSNYSIKGKEVAALYAISIAQ